MKEITEDYVSLETAKLLKEKGFDDCSTSFLENGNMFPTCIVRRKEHYPAPTLQMAMKWLREIHNIDIDVDAHCGMLGIKCYVAYVSTYKPYKLTDTDKEYGLTENDVKHRQIQFKRNTRIPSKGELIPAHEYFDTYEDACGAAIKYCLENLI